MNSCLFIKCPSLTHQTGTHKESHMLREKIVGLIYSHHCREHLVSLGSHPARMQLSPRNTVEVLKREDVTTQSRLGGWVGEAAGGRGPDRENLGHAFQDILAVAGVSILRVVLQTKSLLWNRPDPWRRRMIPIEWRDINPFLPFVVAKVLDG